jgi:hypothetical protein
MDDQDPATLEGRIAQLEQHHRRTYSRSVAETAFWAVMHNIFPEDARRHLKAAGREQLLAARVYLDSWIRRLDDSAATKDDPAPAPLQEKIKVK